MYQYPGMQNSLQPCSAECLFQRAPPPPLHHLPSTPPLQSQCDLGHVPGYDFTFCETQWLCYNTQQYGQHESYSVTKSYACSYFQASVRATVCVPLLQPSVLSLGAGLFQVAVILLC